MKKERLVKCYGIACESENKKYPKSMIATLSSKNYCPDCFKVMKQEKEDRDSLLVVVRRIFNTNGYSSVERLIQTQIKKFHAEGMKYKGMELTLNFMVNQGITFDNRGIALLPYYYDKAREEFIKMRQKKEQTKDFEVKEAQVVMAITSKRTSYKQSKLLSMEDL